MEKQKVTLMILRQKDESPWMIRIFPKEPENIIDTLSESDYTGDDWKSVHTPHDEIGPLDVTRTWQYR